MLAFQARDDLWMSVIPNNLWLVAHFVAQFPPARARTSIQLIQFNAIASSSSSMAPMSHGDAKVFVKFGPARNVSRPTSWRASSLEAQFSDFAFNWLNSSLSSWSKSSHLKFGSDKLSIRLSFLTRLCTPNVVRVLVILINYTRVCFKRRPNWKTMTFKSWWYFPVLLYRFATDFDNIQNAEIISRDCSFIYRSQLCQAVTAVGVQANLEDLCWFS